MYEELAERLREAPDDWPDADLHYEATDAIEELSRANSVLYGALSQWIPVTERLPNAERKSYWGCTDNGYQCECRQFGIIEEKNRRIDRVGLYNRNAEKSAAMYEALAGISPEPPKGE